MRIVKGIPASTGIITGKVFLYATQSLKAPRFNIDTDEVVEEHERFMDALARAKEDLCDLKAETELKQVANELAIIEAHVMMIGDPDFEKKILLGIEQRLMNAECIIEDTIQIMVQSLEETQDEYLKERTVDLYDIQSRLIHQLMYMERASLVDISEEVVLVANNLLPSEVLTMNRDLIKGIVLDTGGKTSHTAILARAFEIPAVVGLTSITKKVNNGDRIIVDGIEGKVFVRPNRITEAEYEKKLKKWVEHEEELLAFHALSARTTDGHTVALKANIEIPEEVDSSIIHGAEGIGLYRSEFLFMRPGEHASEEEQFLEYAKVIKGMKDQGPVTIRTIDVGGDKVLPGVEEFDEENPILGWRAVRFCLSRPDIFKTQLRAMLRASVYGPLRIMFPMISGLEELNQVLEIFEEVKRGLSRDGIDFDHNIKLGTMIEVPSAAMIADVLAKRVDFLSIGTNDLIQYTIAVDRGNEKIAYLYQPLHPGVLRMVKMIIDKGHAMNVPVGMCGEVAADPLYTCVLLGLGLDEFSMSPVGIPEVKRIIRSVSMEDATSLVDAIIELESYEEINRYVRKWMDERFEIFNY